MYLICGLGNPGEKYALTRHNSGFRALDFYADSNSLLWKAEKKHFAEIAKLETPAEAILAKSNRFFMNETGEMVAPLAKYFKIPPQKVIILQDEVDIPFGEIKLKLGGGEAGHNGLRSLSKHLGTKEYFRIRIGVGRSSNSKIPTDVHVLSKFTPNEEKSLPDIFLRVSQVLDSFLAEGLLKTQAKAF